MKRWQKNLLVFIICYISYFLAFYVLSNTSLSEQVVAIISLFFLILPALVYVFIIKKIIQKENNEVSNVSLKINEINKLNKRYSFKKILKTKHRIIEREYSRKSLDRVKGSSIIKYHIENNIDSLRNDIENAIYNIKLLKEYNKDVEEIANYESTNESKYSLKKYKKIEERVFNSLIYKENDFLISLYLEVYYKSNGGNVNDNRKAKFSFEELVDFYNQWKNGKKYEETANQERKIMNDDIRYNVLKRDNFTCKICGVSAKDGAKLHVDHIMPVSKGGKTVMSNLQTLCDRCNIGKNNK